MRRLAFVFLLAACETPPSPYIPPPEPREIPNIDPPPGIPIMPSASASAAPVPTLSPSASAAPPTPPKKRPPKKR